MSGIEIVTAAIKDKAHSFKHIRRTTGLRISDDQFLKLIKENEERLEFTRIRRADAAGKPIRPGRPGVKLRAAASP
jgi:hypothetical protein